MPRSDRPGALRSWVLSNPWTKLASLLLAAAIWLYVQGEEIHEAKVKARISFVLPPDLLATEPLPMQATLTVRGTRAATRRAQDADVQVPVDLSGLGVGEHGLDLGSFPAQGLPQATEVLAVQPASIRFVLDEVAVRKVRVDPVLVGEPAEGFEIGEVVLEPSVVELSGPRGAMASLREVSTQPIDVSGLRSDVVREVALELPRNVVSDALPPLARIPVVSRRGRRELVEIPVDVRGRPDWRVEPAVVSLVLEGPAPTLAGIDPEDVSALVHLPDGPDRGRYEVRLGDAEGARLQIVQPGEGVSVVSMSPEVLTVVRP